MQATSYYDIEAEKERIRLEGFQCGPGEREQARMRERMKSRREELDRRGENLVCAVNFDRKKSDPKRFRRAKRSR